MDYNYLLEVAKSAAQKASEEILRVYNTDNFSVEVKGDNSPLTLADRLSHESIVKDLEKTGLPILSEEGKYLPYETRKDWEYFWMVDPLDGTKEFIKRNGEFTVNIALIKNTNPVIGVVLVPVLNDIYWAVKGKGAFKNGEKIACSSFDFKNENLRVVASRSHLNDETSKYLESLKSPKILSKGSSLKLLLVAEGKADLYPRFAPTMEWDIAAAQIIVEESGGVVNEQHVDKRLTYNKRDLVNPNFLVLGKVEE